MEHIIIGTAGHIDHGKTALIRALTGRDTDQTKEEKERGISIDLGFTYFDLPCDRKAGIIDVPGHERFLPNMLAGVCGMDLVLLVIALDEGIMPQTQEHMDILELMKIPDGIVVLTKLDQVNEEWADLMSEEINEQLQGTVFASWPICRVSSVTGDGIDALKQRIVEVEAQVLRNRSIAGAFRMPIDRIISLKGIGTLVCGTALEGRVRNGSELEIYPLGRLVKVRNIQTHGIDTSDAEAGQRTALLVSNVKKEELKRGMTIAEPDSLPRADRIDVRIRMTRYTERTLKNQSRMHLHIGTAEVLCRVVLYQQDVLTAEEEGYAQLITEQPISVRKGDHFILRFYSPLETIAGGTVIDADAKKKKRNDQKSIDELKKREENKVEEIIIHLLEEYNFYPLSIKEIALEVKEEEVNVEQILSDLVKAKKCVNWHGKKETFYWEYSEAMNRVENLECYLQNYHVQFPYRQGCDKKRIKTEMFPEWKLDRFELLLHQMEQEGRIRIQNQMAAKADFEIQMDDALERFADQICPQLDAAGCQFIEYSKLRSPNQSPMQYNDMIECLIQLGRLVRISDEFVTTTAVDQEIKQRVRAYFRQNAILSYSQLRDLLQSTRKSIRPLMDYLDREKVTEWFGHETERKEYTERRESVE